MSVRKRYEFWGREDEIHFDTIEECLEFIYEYCKFRFDLAENEEELDRQTEMMQALFEFYFTETEYEVEDEEEVRRTIKENQEELREREREYREMQGF